PAGPWGPRALRLADEFGDFRTDHLAPAAARENAVMTAARRRVVAFAGGRDAAAQPDGGAGLALSGDVVELAFDGQQRDVLDVGRTHRLAIDLPGAVGQLEFLEDHADGVQVELGRHVEHGVVLVIEAPVRRRV